MNLISLLGLDSLLERWRANLNEAAIAAEDRVDLAQLEWQQHKRSMQALAVLAIVLGALTVVVLEPQPLDQTKPRPAPAGARH